MPSKSVEPTLAGGEAAATSTSEVGHARGAGSGGDTKIEREGKQEPHRVTGPDVIQKYLKTLPSAPGVYRMLNTDDEVIYVGKARSLKARVSNYARLGGHTNRIARMIATTASMEFVTVRTEAEALLLEANLIKRFRPRFNVLLRDDKSFPYILLTKDHDAPRILKHRGAAQGKNARYGPFASAGAVDRTINMMQRAFLLRTCSDSVYDSRTRPCLLFQIKRCSGPCTGEIAKDDYAALVQQAEKFLRGESQSVRALYQQLMQDASDAMEFERAAAYRNRLWALAHVQADQSINAQGVEEADVFAAHQEGGQTCVQVFFFRSGQNWGNRAYFPKADRSLDAAEVLDSFIAQFYDDKPIPRLILVSHDVPSRALLAEALTSKAERKVEISAPQRGDKANLVAHAAQNAREALGRRLAESASQQKLLSQVAERFALDAPPRRIEVYDNSHISGTNAVGGMIVAGPEGFAKAHYRKFNIKNPETAPGDDYAMMREVLTRRFKRMMKEADAGASDAKNGGASGEGGAARARAARAPIGRDENMADGSAPLSLPMELAGGDDGNDAPPLADNSDMPTRPDLVLIDGGQGQLKVAVEVMEELGVHDIPVIGVAKGPERDAGREHFHHPGATRPIMLEPRDPVLYFVQRLRDEAHRFAIGTHRAKRSKAISANPLDDIEGIGPTRKRALMKHFGSAKSVSKAGLGDLAAVDGISEAMAQKIYDYFHDKK
ncbi:MAG: excinuclease ABC subunit UvrC [Pseudomonadota bacterium]